MVYRRFIKKELSVLLGLFLLTGCATTKLKNFEEGPVMLEQDESRLKNRAVELSEGIDHSGWVFEDAKLKTYLNQIALRLIEPLKNDIKDLKIDVSVVKDPDLNAFSLSNGRIYLHSGILAASENEAQIATILAHEMTHILHRHIVKRHRSIENNLVVWDSVGLLTGGLGFIVGDLMQASTISGFSQELETEADEYGFMLLQKANYDLRETIKIFESFKDYVTGEKINEPFFFSSHPQITKRINNFTRLVNQQKQPISGELNKDFYKQITREIIIINLKLCLHKGMYHTADGLLRRYTVDYANDVAFWNLKGELYRERQDNPKGKKSRDKSVDYKTALEAYDQALKISLKDPDALKGKGRILYLMGDKTQSKMYFQQYLEVKPNAEDKSFINNLI